MVGVVGAVGVVRVVALLGWLIGFAGWLSWLGWSVQWMRLPLSRNVRNLVDLRYFTISSIASLPINGFSLRSRFISAGNFNTTWGPVGKLGSRVSVRLVRNSV